MTFDDIDSAPAADAPDGLSIPVIDLTDGLNPVALDRIARACGDWGFFQIVGHNVSGASMARAMAETRRFFGQTMETKRALLRSKDNPWGYFDRELTKNLRDKKEIFDVGPDAADAALGDSPFTGGTPWPAFASHFEPTMRAHYLACERLSARLLEPICESLNTPRIGLHRFFEPVSTSFLRLNYYPVRDPVTDPGLKGGDLGIHHHTDAGALTLLLQDGVAGLQVYRDGKWHGVTPLPGALVVNIGDMVQVWSNDTYRAPIHRVLAMSRVDRYSIAFFFNPAYDAIIEPFPQTLGSSGLARYKPIRWGEFRRRRADGDYENYGTEVQIADYRA